MIGGSNGCCQCSARRSVPEPAFVRSYGAASMGTLRQKRSTWLFGLPHAATAVMPTDDTPIQHLLTLPPRMAAEFETLEGRSRPAWFASCDPPGMPLGSGGGTA